VERLLAQVRSLVPQDRSLTLAEALAEPSPAAKKTLLDPKSAKYVRRWLDKRRHAYRDRRVSRVTKLLQEFQASEATFLSFLRSVLALRPSMVAAGASAEDLELVFGEISRAGEVHAQLVHLGSQAAGDTQASDPVSQRRFVAEFVLEPLLAVVRSYGTFFSNHWSRQAVLSRWNGEAILAKALNASGAGKAEELLGLVAARVQGYKSLVERLEILLEEERAPERRKDDQETSARVQALAAGIELECARLQAGVASALNWEQVRGLAQLHRLGDAWLAANPHRRFVTQERVRTMQGKKQYDDCLLLVFSDLLILVAGKGAAGVKPGVLHSFELSSTEVEDDTMMSWSEDGGKDDVAGGDSGARPANPLTESGRRPGLIGGFKVCFISNVCFFFLNSFTGTGSQGDCGGEQQQRQQRGKYCGHTRYGGNGASVAVVSSGVQRGQVARAVRGQDCARVAGGRDSGPEVQAPRVWPIHCFFGRARRRRGSGNHSPVRARAAQAHV
jgi:hypothetical protein